MRKHWQTLSHVKLLASKLACVNWLNVTYRQTDKLTAISCTPLGDKVTNTAECRETLSKYRLVKWPMASLACVWSGWVIPLTWLQLSLCTTGTDDVSPSQWLLLLLQKKQTSYTADCAPSATTWAATLSACPFCVAIYAQTLSGNMTLSITRKYIMYRNTARGGPSHGHR